jgi:hypothetical protein
VAPSLRRVVVFAYTVEVLRSEITTFVRAVLDEVSRLLKGLRSVAEISGGL